MLMKLHLNNNWIISKNKSVNKKKYKKGEQKMLKTLGAVYIYIYIERSSNKEKSNIDNKIKLCVLEESKMHGFFST